MKTNDLRIGNYLKDKLTKSFLRVIELTENNIVTTVINRSNFPLPDGWKAIPIIITEEILLMCGAKKFEYHHYYFQIESGHIYFDIYSGKSPAGQDNGVKDDEFYMTINGVLIVLKHLHKLQNLYYEITEKSLEVNLC